MSARAMPAWYMPTWVKSALPVISPTAHTRSVTRMRSSTGTNRCDGTTPIVSTRSPARSVRRPVATNSRSALSWVPSVSSTTTPPSVPERIDEAATPVWTAMPSASKVSRRRAPDSGSSSGSRRSWASTSVTSVPNLAITCDSSEPIAPAPRTIIDSGSSFASITSWLVQ